MHSKKVAVLVDAGYFCAQASETLFNQAKRRDELEIDVKKMLQTMQEMGKTAFDTLDILRVYWYDAPPQRGQMSQCQEAIGLLEGAKLRLGKLNSRGQQKLVDALLCRDIEDLARNKAVDGILLCSGDEDLLMAVEFAQAQGVQVKMLGIGPGHASVGLDIAMASDGVRNINKETVSLMVNLKVNQESANSVRKSDFKKHENNQTSQSKSFQDIHASSKKHDPLLNSEKKSSQAAQIHSNPKQNSQPGKKRRHRKNRHEAHEASIKKENNSMFEESIVSPIQNTSTLPFTQVGASDAEKSMKTASIDDSSIKEVNVDMDVGKSLVSISKEDNEKETEKTKERPLVKKRQSIIKKEIKETQSSPPSIVKEIVSNVSNVSNSIKAKKVKMDASEPKSKAIGVSKSASDINQKKKIARVEKVQKKE